MSETPRTDDVISRCAEYSDSREIATWTCEYEKLEREFAAVFNLLEDATKQRDGFKIAFSTASKIARDHETEITAMRAAVQRVRDKVLYDGWVSIRYVDGLLAMLGLPLEAPVEPPAPKVDAIMRKCAVCGGDEALFLECRCQQGKEWAKTAPEAPKMVLCEHALSRECGRHVCAHGHGNLHTKERKCSNTACIYSPTGRARCVEVGA
jgi:hypothetical protein